MNINRLGKTVCVICLLVLSTLFGSVVLARNSNAATSTSISMGVIQSPVISSLNYISPAENYYVVSELYLPFAAYGFPPGPSLQPILASGWSSNANSTVWVLNLKSNLKWDDGSSLNASDLYYTWWEDNLTSAVSFTSELTSISILNSTAVQITSSVPEPNLVYFWAEQTNSYILPSKTYTPLGSNTSSLDAFTNFQNIVADGPYVIKNYTQGENPIVFTANPDYYQGLPHMQTLDLYSYASLSSELAGYKSGQIDALWAYGAYSIIKPLLQNVTGQSLYEVAPGAEMAIYFNLATWPYNTTQFRQALAYSTNRTAIDDTVNGPGLPLVGYDNLITSLEGQIGVSNSSIPDYSYNLTEAASLLTSLRFQKSGGTWHYPNGTAVTINIITADQGYGEPQTTTVIDSQWTSAGFNVNYVTLDFTSYLTEQEGPTGWQVAVEIDNPGYYPNALGNFLALVGIPGYGGNYNLTLPSVNGVANYNYTEINSDVQNGLQYPINSVQSNAYTAQIAPLVANTVPLIPLFVIYNWQSVSNNYYWGTQSNLTGIFDLQALMQPQLWYDTLYVVQPVSTSTTSTSSSNNNNLYLYIGIAAVVIVVAAVAGTAYVRSRRPKASTT